MSKEEKINVDEIVPCQVRALGLSCYGCCGHDWQSQKEIENDIAHNTSDFNQIYEELEGDLEFFRDRYEKYEMSNSGLCFNMVEFSNKCLACPLHPRVNEIVSVDEVIAPNKDLRVGQCDVDYECETVRYWNLFGKEQKEEFVEFLKSKNMNNYDFSMQNASGELIKEFLTNRNKIIEE